MINWNDSVNQRVISARADQGWWAGTMKRSMIVGVILAAFTVLALSVAGALTPSAGHATPGDTPLSNSICDSCG